MLRTIVYLAALIGVGAVAWIWLARGTPEDRFLEAIDALPGCVAHTECVVIHTECPLECAHAVPETALEEIQSLARTLVAEHTLRSGACNQDCQPPGPAMCVSGRCKLSKRIGAQD